MADTLGSKLLHLYRRTSRFGGVIAIVLIVSAFFVLSVQGVEINEKILLVALIVLLTGVVAVANEAIRSVEALAQDLERVERMVEMRKQERLTLEECQNDLMTRVKASGASRVFIQHLGLDMANAWNRIRLFIENDFTSLRIALKEIEMHILVLDQSVLDSGESWVRAMVEEWASKVAWFEKNVQSLSPDVQERVRKAGKRLRITVRAYNSMPQVHGFAVPQPGGAYYFSMVRWVGDAFDRLDWGDGYYRRVDSRDVEHKDADLVAVFRGKFGHLWEHGSRLLVDFDTGVIGR